MRVKNLTLAELEERVITIGFVDENLYTQVRIDCKELFDEHPDAIPSLAVQPPQGDAYPAVVTRDGDIVVWNVAKSDVQYANLGRLQLTFVIGEIVAKSYVGKFVIDKSLMPDGEAPTPIENWITEANAVLGEIPSTIAEAVDDALEEAKESGEFDGADGVSPVVNVTKTQSGHNIVITDAEGYHSFEVPDGTEGKDGVTPQFGIGTVSEGHTADVTMTGTKENPVLNFVMPKVTTEDIVAVQDTQPTAEETAIWFPETPPMPVQVPTYAEYTAFKSDTENSMSSLSTEITNVGDILVIEDKTHKSKNLNITPYATATVNGVTFTVGNDGTVTLSGTPTKNTYWPNLSDTSFRWQLPAGVYTFSGGDEVDNWRSPTLILYATQDASENIAEYPIGRYGHETETFTVASDCWAAVRFFVDSRNSALSTKFYPQVEAGDEATSYESPWIQTSETVSVELENRSKPKPVIVDTDIGNDSDDALAVRVLSYFDSIGAIRLLMASCFFNTINALKGISALLNYDGTVNVPIILKNSNYTESTGEYLDTLIAYPFTQSTPKNLYGATAYRKVLAESKEKVNLIFLGPLTNLSDLLDSSADTISDKNGIALVTEKVDKIFVMGGAYPDSVEAMDGNGATIGGVVVPGAEWNFAGDISATANVITNCPVPMIFCGWEIGRAIPCGGGISGKLPQNDAMIAVMNKHGGSSEVTNGRYGYDPITAAVACLDDAGKMGFELVRGTVVYNSTNSTNTFTASATGKHYYVTKKYENDYYKIFMNHILSKDWWGANNAVQNGRANI